MKIFIKSAKICDENFFIFRKFSTPPAAGSRSSDLFSCISSFLEVARPDPRPPGRVRLLGPRLGLSAAAADRYARPRKNSGPLAPRRREAATRHLPCRVGSLSERSDLRRLVSSSASAWRSAGRRGASPRPGWARYLAVSDCPLASMPPRRSPA